MNFLSRESGFGCTRMKMNATEDRATGRIVGRIGREYFLLDAEEIFAFQAEGENVWIVTRKRRFLATQPLRLLETSLPAQVFHRIHRNAIVNVRHVRKLSALPSNRCLLTLSNNSKFIVSKRQAHNVRKLLLGA